MTKKKISYKKKTVDYNKVTEKDDGRMFFIGVFLFFSLILLYYSEVRAVWWVYLIFLAVCEIASIIYVRGRFKGYSDITAGATVAIKFESIVFTTFVLFVVGAVGMLGYGLFKLMKNQWLNILTWTGIIIGSIAVISLIVFVFIKVNQFIFKTTLNKK